MEKKPLTIYIAAIILGVVTLLVYLPALNGDFLNWDDDRYILNNQAIKSPDTRTISWVFGFHEYNWHPLTWLSHATDSLLFGQSARGHHFTSILLHALNSGFLLWVLWRYTGNLGASAITACLFAFHPCHVESVAWISERKDVLSALFWILAMGAYIRYVEKNTRGRYFAVTVSLVLGLMAKSMLVTLPVIFILLDFWPLRRFSRQTVMEKLPFFGIAAVAGILTIIAQRIGGATMALEILGMKARLANAVWSYCRYMVKMFWPVDLVAFYPLSSGAIGYSTLTVVFAGAVLFIITVFAIRYLREAPYFLVGWCWYLITLVPVIGILQVGLQSMALRYTYIPSIGIFMAAGWFAAGLFSNRLARIPIIAITVSVLVVLSVLTIRQIAVWQNPVTLWQHNASVYPDTGFIHYKLGQALGLAGDQDRAAASYEKSIELNPDNFEALINLGNYHYRKGMAAFRTRNTAGKDNHWKLAEEMYQRSIDAQPDQSTAYSLLGALRIAQKRLQEGLELCQRALNNNPADATARNYLGVAFAQQGNLEEAMTQWQQALAYDPQSTEAHMNLAQAYYLKKDFPAARQHYQQVLAIDPGNMAARKRLGELSR